LVATISDEKLLDVVGGREHLFGAGAYADVFGEILPAHGTGTVDKELCGTGDVVSIGTRRGVQQTVSPDHIQIGIRQEREGEVRFAAQVCGHLRSVHADGDRANTERLEFLKLLLYAP
jgi:hypothetical protein